MKYQLLLISSLILLSNQLPAQACSEGNSNSTDYIRRTNPNRCEGIKREQVSGNQLELISFATRNIGSYGNSLTLTIPRLNNSDPPALAVSAKTQQQYYSLDEPSLSLEDARFTFTWDTNILKKENIPPNNLRALAYFSFGSQEVYAPVILGKTSGKYEFVFFTPSRAKFPVWEIIHNGTVVEKQKSPNLKSGEITFNWNGQNAPAGRYQLHYIADVNPPGEQTERIERWLDFEHNPNWLQ